MRKNSYKILLSRLANIFSKALLRAPVNDLTSGFKCVRKRILKSIDFTAMRPKGYVFPGGDGLPRFLKWL